MTEEHADEEKPVTEVAVQVGRVIKADLRVRIEAYGTVEPEPAGEGKPAGAARLAAPVAGVVLAVPVKEGQSVEAGTIVVRLDDRLASAVVEKAQHNVMFAEQQLARQNNLRSGNVTSVRAVEEAAQQLALARAELAIAQAQLAQVRLTSPLSGIVARISVQPGQAVDQNTVVAEIIDLKRLVVTLNVPADDVMQLKVGDVADLFTETTDKPAATGRVSFVSPLVDPKAGVVLVRVALPEDSGLRGGRFVRARIVTQELVGRLAVPTESVVKADEVSVVYIVHGDKAEQKPVKTGVRDGDLIEVEAEGLQEGDTIVTVGAYGLPNETKIRVVSQANYADE